MAGNNNLANAVSKTPDPDERRGAGFGEPVLCQSKVNRPSPLPPSGQQVRREQPHELSVIVHS